MKSVKFCSVISASLLLCLSVASYGGPFTPEVSNDIYSGVPNGIPTANDSNDGQPDQFEAVNFLLGTSYTGNADLDDRFVTDDAVFYGTGTHTIALIGLTAGNHNTLGFYTDLGTGNERTEILGPVSVLEPSSIALFALGLLALGVVRRKPSR